VVFGRERQGPHRVVGLAAEEALLREDRPDVGGGAGAAGDELVERATALVGFAEHVHRVVELVETRNDFGRAMRTDHPLHQDAIDTRGVVPPDCVTVTFLEVARKVGDQRCRPCDATFEERETQRREPREDAAEKQRTAQRLARRAERSEVIRHVVRR